MYTNDVEFFGLARSCKEVIPVVSNKGDFMSQFVKYATSAANNIAYSKPVSA